MEKGPAPRAALKVGLGVRWSHRTPQINLDPADVLDRNDPERGTRACAPDTYLNCGRGRVRTARTCNNCPHHSIQICHDQGTQRAMGTVMATVTATLTVTVTVTE
ncbi:MAG TPA: hypothetical protein VGZ00_11030 [Candidatus Baltobacteraceae bacterium]|nr:hypothetical protein [Candidatus Baltobacteraceae bacterium]